MDSRLLRHARPGEAGCQHDGNGPNWPFLLRYFGPNQLPNGGTTYRYISAYSVCYASQYPTGAANVGITPDMFRDKIVLIGGTAGIGTFDLKSSPLSGDLPRRRNPCDGDRRSAKRPDCRGTGPSRRAHMLAAAHCSQLIAAAALCVIPRDASTPKTLLALIACSRCSWSGFAVCDVRWPQHPLAADGIADPCCVA